MLKKTIAISIIMLLDGCATRDKTIQTIEVSSTKQHTLSLDTGKKLSFKTLGCNVEGGSIKNDGNYASAGSYGTLIASNTKGNVTLDQYRLSCGALPAKGVAACVIQHVEGDASNKNYGGSGCPDMKFNVINFRSF